MAVCEDCIYFKDFCSIQGMNRNARTDCFKFKDKTQFIELPCKVGDTMYCIKGAFGYLREPRSEKIEKIEIGIDKIFWTEKRGFTDKAIGKTVFLTREAAEKSLKESEGK